MYFGDILVYFVLLGIVLGFLFELNFFIGVIVVSSSIVLVLIVL